MLVLFGFKIADFTFIFRIILNSLDTDFKYSLLKINSWLFWLRKTFSEKNVIKTDKNEQQKLTKKMFFRYQIYITLKVTIFRDKTPIKTPFSMIKIARVNR